ncbi:MAG: Mov34/MPN/PAD-1 family protein [Myxococcales bacterium]|nr:Mov34/MPN/PAD-1 family protein [Myxococcales bacterium]
MRDPMAVLGRFGRQLLVNDVALPDQQALANIAFVPAHDSTPGAIAAAQVAARYLVAAGLGRVAGDPEIIGDLSAIDSTLVTLASVADAAPPVVHLYFATRPYGASVDIVATANPDGWAEGRSRNAHVCTAAFEFGEPCEPVDASLVGAVVAELVTEHLLVLSPLPAVIRFAWPDDAEPKVYRRLPGAAPEGGEARTGSRLPPGLFAEMRAATDVLPPIFDDCLAQYPNEACGLVVRKPDGRLETVVCKNLQDRYHALDPETYVRTARAAFKLNVRKIASLEEAGDTLVSIYHSHCDAGAYFSDEDVRSAAPEGTPLYPNVGYLVVSVMGGAIRASEMFHFDDSRGGFAPES